MYRNVQMFEVSLDDWIAQKFAFSKKQKSVLRQNGIHQENVEIRDVICQNNVRAFWQFRPSHLAHMIKTDDAKGPTPHHKNVECALLVAVAKQQRVDERKKEDRHDDKENPNVNFPDQR